MKFWRIYQSEKTFTNIYYQFICRIEVKVFKIVWNLYKSLIYLWSQKCVCVCILVLYTRTERECIIKIDTLHKDNNREHPNECGKIQRSLKAIEWLSEEG